MTHEPLYSLATNQHPQATTVLETRDLAIAYTNILALDKTNINFYKNRINAIIGPSGCGKSSLIQAITRISQYIDGCTVTGEVSLAEDKIILCQTNYLKLQSKFGIIFQKPTPFPFSIYKNFALPLKEIGIRNRHDITDIMEQKLKLVGLWNETKGRLKTSAHLLSGGQQQRLCIARALALEPEILFLDEPCSALDPISTRKIEELLIELKQTKTIVMVTHNIAQAKRISDYTAVFWTMDGVGHLIEHDQTQIVFDNPRHKYTRAYIQGHSG